MPTGEVVPWWKSFAAKPPTPARGPARYSPSWYDRWNRGFGHVPRNSGAGAGVGQQDSWMGPQENYQAYDYLLNSMRVNAPGFSEGDAFTLSRAFTGATYLAINTLCNQAMQSEKRICEDINGDEIEVSDWEECVAVTNSPNPDDSWGELMYQFVLQKKLTGTALGWIPHDYTSSYSRPEEMYCLSTASVIPQPISPRYPGGAYLVQPWYPAGPFSQVPMQQGVGTVVPAEQIIRIKQPHPFFRWVGYSTLFAISQQMDVSRMIDSSRLNAMAKGVDPTAIMTFDPSIKQPTDPEIRRMEIQFANIWQGPQNAGRILFAPAGGQITKLSNTPSEMAYQEGWLQLLDFGLAAFGVNKAVAGITADLNYSTLFASLRAFYLLTLGVELEQIANKMTTRFLQPFYNRRFFMKLTGKTIMDDELKERENQLLLKGGVIKVGELRKRYGLPHSERDNEWASMHPKEQGGREGAAPMGGQTGEDVARTGEDRDYSVEQNRPETGSTPGEGLGLNKSLAALGKIAGQEQVRKRFERQQAVLEREMTKGRAHPVYPNGRKTIPVS